MRDTISFVSTAFEKLPLYIRANPRPDRDIKFNNRSAQLYTLHGGKQEGVKVVNLSNGKVSAEIAIDLGGSIRQFVREGSKAAWKFLGGDLTGPAHLRAEEKHGLAAFLDNFGPLAGNLAGGGHAGPVSKVKSQNNVGADVTTLLPLHGYLGLTPASDVKVHNIKGKDQNEKDAIMLEATFHEGHHQFGNWLTHVIRYTLRDGETQIAVEHEIKNDSKSLQNIMAMYHLNQATQPGDKVIAPIETIRARDNNSNANKWSSGTYTVVKENDMGEEVNYAKLKVDSQGDTTSAIVSEDGKTAVSFSYNEKDLPDTTLWVGKNTGVAIEPGSHHSVAKQILADDTIKEFGVRPLDIYDPGESRTMKFTVGLHDGDDEVNAVKAKISSIQDGSAIKVDTNSLESIETIKTHLAA